MNHAFTNANQQLTFANHRALLSCRIRSWIPGTFQPPGELQFALLEPSAYYVNIWGLRAFRLCVSIFDELRSRDGALVLSLLFSLEISDFIGHDLGSQWASGFETVCMTVGGKFSAGPNTLYFLQSFLPVRMGSSFVGVCGFFFGWIVT